VTTHRLGVPVERDAAGNATKFTPVTLQGGAGADVISSFPLIQDLPGGLVDDALVNPLVLNNPSSIFNPLSPVPFGFIFSPPPYTNTAQRADGFASFLDGGYGNDILIGWQIGDGSGRTLDKEVKQWPSDGTNSKMVEFTGLHTLVGGQGSDTFIVRNGGKSLGDTFDYVRKYDKETPVNYGNGGVGASLNGGQHNLVISAVDYLTLSDTEVDQGKFIDQLGLAEVGQFGMGNRLDNYIFDGIWGPSAENTLVGGVGRDSIVGNSSGDVLIGGTAYKLDNVGFAIVDFAQYGQLTSPYRDTDPVSVNPNGSGTADPSQFWFLPGFYKYGSVFDGNRNSDTLTANSSGPTGFTLDGGAGSDYMYGSDKSDDFYVSASNINYQGWYDEVVGRGGNDTIIFTDSDYLWWKGHQEGSTLAMNGYSLIPESDISNLTLQMGAPTARNAIGNSSSRGNDQRGWFEEVGSNRIVGNEFDNILDGWGVGSVGGVDTLTGGQGSDLFVISSYDNAYIGASNTAWEIDLIRVSSNPDLRAWDLKDSNYTDADYVIVQDFTTHDSLDLSGTGWWIGRAPGFFGENNVRPSDDPLSGITTTRFGIYRSGVYDQNARNQTGQGQFPDLVAVINTTNGLELDLSSLNQVAPGGAALTPSAGQVDGATAAAGHLGWGAFFDLSQARFNDQRNFTNGANSVLRSQGDFATNIQTPSTASLTDILGQLA
jgi:hypothetical protein